MYDKGTRTNKVMTSTGRKEPELGTRNSSYIKIDIDVRSLSTSLCMTVHGKHFCVYTACGVVNSSVACVR